MKNTQNVILGGWGKRSNF